MTDVDDGDGSRIAWVLSIVPWLRTWEAGELWRALTASVREK